MSGILLITALVISAEYKGLPERFHPIAEATEGYRTKRVDALKGEIEKARIAESKVSPGSNTPQNMHEKRQDLVSRLIALEAGDEPIFPQINVLNMKLGQAGQLPPPNRVPLKVMQVIGTEQMIVDSMDYKQGVESFFLFGVSTKGLVDGKRFETTPDPPEGHIFHVSRTLKYDTAAGGTRTAIVVEPIDVRPYREWYRKQPRPTVEKMAAEWKPVLADQLYTDWETHLANIEKELRSLKKNRSSRDKNSLRTKVKELTAIRSAAKRVLRKMEREAKHKQGKESKD